MDAEQLTSLLDGHHDELRELEEGLRDEAPHVAVVFRRMMEAFRPVQGGRISLSSTPPAEVKQLQELAWDKLHLGHWQDVAMVWRELYGLTCLLEGTCHLSAISPRGDGGQAADAPSSQRAAAARHYDLGIMMGGPAFAPLLHKAVRAMEQQDREHARSLYAATSAGTDTDGATHTDRQAKRQRTAVAEATAEGTSAPDSSEAVCTGDHSVANDDSGMPADASTAAVQLPAGSLQHGHPQGLCSAVPRVHLPPLETFAIEYMSHKPHGRPVIVTGGMEHWPAMKTWRDIDYLRRMAGHRTVPVEVGEHYLADGWGQQLMTLTDFIDTHILSDANTHTDTAHTTTKDKPDSTGPTVVSRRPADATPDNTDIGSRGKEGAAQAPAGAADAAAGVSRTRGYLAQHALFRQIPALAQDIREPEYCCLGGDEEEGGGVQAVNAWFGPAGTLTPLHTDPHHNLLCQVVGHKYVRLYAPDATPAMYPYTEGLTTNSSQVDIMSVDTERYPEFTKAPYQDCMLGPGEMLYIPPKWWHAVIATSVSFSVSYWWR